MRCPSQYWKGDLKNTLHLPLRVVFYYESDRWIAHCLEFDLPGDGETKEGALESLSTAIRIQVEETLSLGHLGNLFSPAEGKYFQMFGQGRHVAIGKVHLQVEGFEFDEILAREYVGEEPVCPELAIA